MKIKDLKEYIDYEVIIWREVFPGEFDTLYDGYLKNAPTAILNLSVIKINAKKRDIFDIKVQLEKCDEIPIHYFIYM